MVVLTALVQYNKFWVYCYIVLVGLLLCISKCVDGVAHLLASYLMGSDFLALRQVMSTTKGAVPVIGWDLVTCGAGGAANMW